MTARKPTPKALKAKATTLHMRREQAFATMGGPGDAQTSLALARPCMRGTNVTERTCSVQGCARPFAARGWCNTHYMQWRRATPADERRVEVLGPTRIRTLRYGELPPDTEPKRYKSTSGYVRLRWWVGPCDLVECYEHRAVMGFPPPEVEVHHKNHVRDDNRPENLELVDSAAHGERHRSLPYGDICAAYATGLSTPAVAAMFGTDHGNIWRVLTHCGVSIRPGWTYNRVDVDVETVRDLHLAGVRSLRIARALGVGRQAVVARIRELGLPPHRAGRPTAAERRAATAALDAYRVGADA